MPVNNPDRDWEAFGRTDPYFPLERGERLIRRLASLISDGGVGMFHVPYSTGRASLVSRGIHWARMNMPAGEMGAQHCAGSTTERACSREKRTRRYFFEGSGPCRTRTCDRRIMSPLL